MPSPKEIILPDGAQDADFAQGSVFFIGTATVLLRYAGFTILTDPNFLHKDHFVRLGGGLRSRRLTNPAIEINELPPYDLIVLSHMHDDHFDQVAEHNIDKATPIITTRHAALALGDMGFTNARATNTWDSFTFIKGAARLRVTSMPGVHGPGATKYVLPQVMGSMLEFMDESDVVKLRLYISGDTLIHDALHEIPHRYPDIDLALLHLGGTRVLGLMLTMDSKQGVEALRIIAPDMAIPIHYNDYTVFKSPLEDFKREVSAAGLEQKVHYLSHGETYDFAVPG